MKSKKIIVLALIVIVVLLFFNFSLLYKTRKVNDDFKNAIIKIKMLELERQLSEIKMIHMENNFIYSLQYNGNRFNDFLIHDTTCTFKFSKLLNEQPKLIFFFSEYNCEKCYKFELANIIQDTLLNKENIVIIGQFQNKRTYLSHLKSSKNRNLNIYAIDKKDDDMLEWLNIDAPLYFQNSVV